MKYIYPFFLLLYLCGMLFLHGKNTAVLPQIGDQGNHGQDQRSIDQNLFHNHKSTTKVRDQDDDHKHLADGFAFSPVVGCDHDTVIGSDQTETADHKLIGQVEKDWFYL